MAYAPIAKIEKFTSEENDTQVWLNNVEKAITANRWNDTRAIQAIPYFLQDTADSWYQSLANKPQDFNAFKLVFLQYFSNNNSINHLANTFITIKQEENKVITIYLGCFHRNLHQIQTIQADYFTVSQILNQFIRSLHSINFQATVTSTRNFEAAELEANHAQAINLSHPSLSFNQLWQQETHICHNCVSNSKLILTLRSILTLLYPNDTTANLLTTCISSSNLSADNTHNLSTAAPIYLLATVLSNLSTPTKFNTTTKLASKRNPKAKNNTTKLEIGNSSLSADLQFFNPVIKISTMEFGHWIHPKPKFSTLFKSFAIQKQSLTSNISPAIITDDKTLAAIFPFEFKKTTPVPLFSEVILNTKLITAMYTNAKVNRQAIKLILNSGSAGSYQVDYAASTRIITADGVTKTSISKIDDFLFKVNSVITLIKVLDGQYTRVSVICDHFKPNGTVSAPLIEFKKEKKNPPEKLTKFYGPTKTTTSYHQYSFGMTIGKKSKKKNLPEIQTKSRELTTTRKS
ncbi:hypothetical protein G9A89_022694 [Geosiphon pyriformis]|nr:hypothetical protein G9A89_022694 [Geosiphon pyriformis]